MGKLNSLVNMFWHLLFTEVVSTDLLYIPGFLESSFKIIHSFSLDLSIWYHH